jgi:hypothetical protein
MYYFTGEEIEVQGNLFPFHVGALLLINFLSTVKEKKKLLKPRVHRLITQVT